MKYLVKEQAHRGALGTIEKLAQQHNTTADNVALRIVKNRRPEIESYVRKFGVEPAENAAALAVQATLINEDRIAQKQAEGIPDYSLAQRALWQDEIELEENGAENFIGGSLLASVTRAGKKGIEKVNEKRREKNKKPLFGGKAWRNLKTKVGDKVQIQVDNEGYTIKGKLPEGKPANPDSEINAAVKAVSDSLTEDAKKDWIKDHKNELIFGSLLVVVVVFMIGKNAK